MPFLICSIDTDTCAPKVQVRLRISSGLKAENGIIFSISTSYSSKGVDVLPEVVARPSAYFQPVLPGPDLLEADSNQVAKPFGGDRLYRL